jgi:hypothetical protein
MFEVSFKPRRRLALYAVLLIGLTGCGQATGTVKGKVTFKGVPIARGLISFVPDRGAPHPAAIIDGAYETDAMPVGEYRITITINTVPGAPTTSKQGENTSGLAVGEGLGPADRSPPPAKNSTATKLDEKYSSPESSGMKFMVQVGPNNYDPPDLK